MPWPLSAFAASGRENPECNAPANPGGRWNFICRQVGKSVQDQEFIDLRHWRAARRHHAIAQRVRYSLCNHHRMKPAQKKAPASAC
ncbi:hypothetical protein [Pseudooceanicola flagellatus]|uniref:hypothetical protein n=1 Tax=Primorskyibacter flagellatus TaxID=1387277 RepID=UPI000A0030CC